MNLTETHQSGVEIQELRVSTFQMCGFFVNRWRLPAEKETLIKIKQSLPETTSIVIMSQYHPQNSKVQPWIAVIN